tara:strand:- start:736 stop:1152 length:417 start_codon:yes stop_codon:yes gene_type:complete
MSTLITGTIKSPTANTPPVFEESSGTSIGTLVRAHARFNGADPNNSSTSGFYNVTDITDLGVGDYRLNFTNSIRDNSGTLTSKYAVGGSSNGPVTPSPHAHCHLFVFSQLSNQLEVELYTDENSGHRVDGYVGVIISA